MSQTGAERMSIAGNPRPSTSEAMFGPPFPRPDRLRYPLLPWATWGWLRMVSALSTRRGPLPQIRQEAPDLDGFSALAAARDPTEFIEGETRWPREIRESVASLSRRASLICFPRWPPRRKTRRYINVAGEGLTCVGPAARLTLRVIVKSGQRVLLTGRRRSPSRRLSFFSCGRGGHRPRGDSAQLRVVGRPYHRNSGS